jgi:hypothetical protein
MFGRLRRINTILFVFLMLALHALNVIWPYFKDMDLLNGPYFK